MSVGWAFLLLAPISVRYAASERITLRGVKVAPAGTPIVGWGDPMWGGRSFDASPLAVNIWANAPASTIVGDLNPTAPFDRMDKLWTNSLTKAAPLEPGMGGSRGTGFQSKARPDWIPPGYHPDPFPAEGVIPKSSRVMNDGDIVSVPDIIRAPNRLDNLVNFDPASNYPLTAPADRINGGPYPVAAEDKVAPWAGRYLDASYDRNVQLQEFNRIHAEFEAVDANKDGAISNEEFKAEVEGRQNKTEDDSMTLWKKFHLDTLTDDMSEVEFKRLAVTGFDALVKGRLADITTVLHPPATADMGFWGSGQMCPNNTFVEAISLKMASTISALKLRCSDKSELSTIEGKDGTWTGWSQCPESQVNFGFRVKKQPFDIARGRNAALKDMAFECRSASMTAMSRLPPVGAAQGGGWTGDLACDSSSAICGAQARLIQGGEVTNQGLSDIRLFCCKKEIDCNAVCQGTHDLNDGTYAQCMVCQHAKYNADHLAK